MGNVIVDISMSLDGFIAGPNDGPGNGLGDGGERLHEWVFGLESWRERHGLEGGEAGRDAEVLEEVMANLGAVVLGKRMFDNAEGWGDEPPFAVPVFVLTHEAREKLVKGQTSFTFVSDGIESAFERARSAAGEGDISIAGGAETIQQYLAAGLIEELQVHVVPVLLGAGIRLFDGLGDSPPDLELTRVIESPAVTHLKYRVVRERS